MPRGGGGWGEGNGTQQVALGQGFLAMQAQLNLVPVEEHRVTHSCLQQSSKARFVPSERRRLAGSADAGVSIPESERVFLKSSCANLFSSPHSCPSHPCWKLLSSSFCLPPCFPNMCTAISQLPGPLRQLLWVLAGRRLLPPGLHQERKEAVLGWHGMWHPCYRRGETKGRAIAGLRVCPTVLHACTLPWPWGKALEVVKAIIRAGLPSATRSLHTAQLAIPHSWLSGKNRQLAVWSTCPLCLHFMWPCWGAF